MRLIDVDDYCKNRCMCNREHCDKEKCSIYLAPPTIDPESLRPKGEWISVEDRLPEEHVTVLVLCKNGAMFTGYCFCDYCDDMRWKIHTALSSTKLLNKGRVSHWMPLPKPPNTEVAHDS